MAEIKDIAIRTLKREDANALVEIDMKLLGKRRPQYWEMKIELLEHRAPIASLVAEMDGKVVGFVLGDASGWEFGIPDTTGWIDSIGVDPGYQKRGIGQALVRAAISHMKKVGVGTIYGLVNWRDWDMLKFLNKIGFTRGDMINLELKVGNQCDEK